MTPGSIDLKIVGGRLDLVEQYLSDLRGLPSGSMEQFVANRLYGSTLQRRNHCFDALLKACSTLQGTFWQKALASGHYSTERPLA